MTTRRTPTKTAAAKTTAAKAPAAKKPTISQAHKDDMAKLAVELVKAAERYDLCDAFYDEIDAINEGLVVPLPVAKPATSCTFHVEMELHGEFPTKAERSAWGGVQHVLPDDQIQKLQNAISNAIHEAIEGLYPQSGLSSFDLPDITIDA